MLKTDHNDWRPEQSLTAGLMTHGQQDPAVTWLCPRNPQFWALCKAEAEHNCRAGAPRSFPVLCHHVPAAHRSTPASRRRFSWCPVHPRSWRARSHLGGHREGRGTARNPSGASKRLPGPPGHAEGVPPGWEHLGLQHQQWLPSKPTDFQGSVGGKVCVEQVLRLQVAVDDSVFMQILQRERENKDAEREGGRWTLGRWLGLAGPGSGAQHQRCLWDPPFVLLKQPPGASAGQRKDIFRAKFPFLNPLLPWKPHFQPTPAVARR